MNQPHQSTFQQEFLGLLQSYLQDQFGCHTAILYGSWARGDRDATSDIDVIAFHDDDRAEHLAHEWQGHFLDLFLERSMSKPEPSWLRFHDGTILFQRGAYGEEVLAAVRAMHAAGPAMLNTNEARTRRLWLRKMLARAEKGDPEGNYRWHWLVMALLEDYFSLRGEWYLGPKNSLTILRQKRPEDVA